MLQEERAQKAQRSSQPADGNSKRAGAAIARAVSPQSAHAHAAELNTVSAKQQQQQLVSAARRQQESAIVLADALHVYGDRVRAALKASLKNGRVSSLPFWPNQASRHRPIFGRKRSGDGVSFVDTEGSLADELSKILRSGTRRIREHQRRKHLNPADRNAPPGSIAMAFSLAEEPRDIAVITTASLPWMTGTAVNPLFRAAYLSLRNDCTVTLVVPYLPPSDQLAVHPNNVFSDPEQQEEYIRRWVADRVGFQPEMEVRFYPGRYARDKCSIIPVGDITQCIPDSRADIAVLEEPEHLTWYHHGTRWTQKFHHVVGVVHTNYLEYAKRESNGFFKEKALCLINKWVCRAYCDKVVKLSDAVQVGFGCANVSIKILFPHLLQQMVLMLFICDIMHMQPLPRASTSWVHGVAPRFIDVGVKKSKQQAECLSSQNSEVRCFSLGLHVLVWKRARLETYD